MKAYSIARGLGRVTCHVIGDAGEYALPHVVYHSPDGFECGYGGSGPADLALSILADFFDEAAGGEAGHAALKTGARRAWSAHQAFKWRFIAGLRELPAVITSEQITAWLDSLEGAARTEVQS